MNLKKKILEATEYGGDKGANRKALSASELTNDPLQVWLRHKHGVLPQDDINMATIGTLCHMAMSDIFSKDDGISTEVDLEMSIGAWKLTGTADMIDENEKVIYDWKFAKKYRYQKIMEQGIDDPYTIQINAYRMMVKEETGMDYAMKIVFISPDAGVDFRRGRIEEFMKVYDAPLVPDAKILDMFNSHREMIELHDAMGTSPEKCRDTWPRKLNGKTVPVKCMFYCSYNKLCPHYNPKEATIASVWSW